MENSKRHARRTEENGRKREWAESEKRGADREAVDTRVITGTIASSWSDSRKDVQEALVGEARGGVAG